MTPPPPSRAVKVGYTLATALLVLAVGFGFVALASIGVGVARHGDSLLYGNTLTVPLQLSSDDIGPLPPGLRVDSWLDTNVEIHNPTSKQMLLRSATDLGPLVLLVAGLWLVRGLLKTVLVGDPFGPPNVRRLRTLGFLLVAGGPAVELLNYMFRSALYNDMPVFPSVNLGSAGFSLPGGALLGGLGAFIIAEVFAHGSRLREDVEGTI
jgi:hypothetical protein